MISSEIANHLEFNDNGSKIILFVIDGLGGLPLPKTGLTELESAKVPNLNKLASKGINGMIVPIAPGIAPGSGVAHLALFGYDPFKYDIGRGAVAAYGIGLEMADGDVAFRINFAAFYPNGAIADRKAYELPTEKNVKLCEMLKEIKKIDGVDVTVETVYGHRAVGVFRGECLHPNLTDSDPVAAGKDVFPLEVKWNEEKAIYTARIANAFIKAANDVLRSKQASEIWELPNGQYLGILTRGYSGKPVLPRMSEIYGLDKLGAIASYPDYRGIARIVGLDVLYEENNLSGEFDKLEEIFHLYDFIFLHVKEPDTAGELGRFDEKIKLLEKIDEFIPRIERLFPDVLIVTGDHSSPATYKSHSWHPVPFTLTSKWCRPDGVKKFCESECRKGSLGTFPATEVMLQALGYAGRIKRFRA